MILLKKAIPDGYRGGAALATAALEEAEAAEPSTLIPPLLLRGTGGEGGEEDDVEEDDNFGESLLPPGRAEIMHDAPSWVSTLVGGAGGGTDPTSSLGGGTRARVRRRTQSAAEWVSYSKMHLAKTSMNSGLPKIGSSIENSIGKYARRTSTMSGLAKEPGSRGSPGSPGSPGSSGTAAVGGALGGALGGGGDSPAAQQVAAARRMSAGRKASSGRVTM